MTTTGKPFPVDRRAVRLALWRWFAESQLIGPIGIRAERNSSPGVQNPATMKTNNITIWMATACVSATLLASCSNTPAEDEGMMNANVEEVQQKSEEAATEVRQLWVEEKLAVVQELRELQTEIDQELAKTEVKLADKALKAEERVQEEARSVELKKQHELVSTQLEKVESGTEETWTAVKGDAQRTLEDFKAWWEKQKDHVDAKTGSDNDGDGK